MLGGAALLALSHPRPAQGGPVARPECGASTDVLEREAVLAEVSAFYRDLRTHQWAALLDHFWPAKITALWDPPVGDGAWQDSPRPESSPGEGASACGCYSVDAASGDPASAEIHVVAAWARVLISPCRGPTVQQDGSERHALDELWLLRVSGRWKIVHLESAVGSREVIRLATPSR